MKKLRFETEQELQLFCLNRLAEIRNFELSEINNPMCFSIMDIVTDISDVLICSGLVKVHELEE